MIDIISDIRNNDLSEICDQVLQLYPGNVIEIGAGEGYTTQALLQVSSKHNSKVIVIDPFEDGWQDMPESYGRPYPYNTFLNNVSGYEKYIILEKISSQDKSVYDRVSKNTPISFSFVDGLQYREAVLNDLLLMSELSCIVIGVDDYKRLTDISQVSLAVDDFLKIKDYTLIVDDKIERSRAFLIKNKI